MGSGRAQYREEPPAGKQEAQGSRDAEGMKVLPAASPESKEAGWPESKGWGQQEGSGGLRSCWPKCNWGRGREVAVKEEVGGEFTTLQRRKGSGKCTLV